MEEVKDFLFEDFNLAIFFGESGFSTLEQEFQETVLQRGINCLGLSNVAGNETTSPQNPPEAAQEAHSTQEYHHECEAAEGLRQELGQHQDDRQPEQEFQETVLQLGINFLALLYVAGNETTSPQNPPEAAQCEKPAAAGGLRQELGQPQDDRQPEQEFQENVLQPSINQLTICHCLSERNPEESLQLDQQKDESQLAEVTKNSDDDLNGVYPEHSEGDYMHNIEVGDELSVVNFIGVEPLHQELDQADYSHHLVLSDTEFFNLGDPGDDGDLFLMQISMDIFD